MPHSHLSDIISSLEISEPEITELKDELFEEKGVQVFMLRLDKVHPVISGNKFFKLIYFLEEAIRSDQKTIITFGGAYSNHLAATAFACNKMNLKCIGIVRGEEPENLSHTLRFCKEQGMKLEFVSRSFYTNIDANFLQRLKNKYGEYILIPEGGFSIKGKEGATMISNYFADKNFSHVCLPVGTATTFAGIVDSNKSRAKIMGLGVLKNLNDISERFAELKVEPAKEYSFIGDYHFGGYAKKNAELISFMNDFYSKHFIQLDFVYTAKMMFGVYDLLAKDYFSAGSNILCIHTGGLQGNASLDEGKLTFLKK